MIGRPWLVTGKSWTIIVDIKNNVLIIGFDTDLDLLLRIPKRIVEEIWQSQFELRLISIYFGRVFGGDDADLSIEIAVFIFKIGWKILFLQSNIIYLDTNVL